jgi:hypothetical protein
MTRKIKQISAYPEGKFTEPGVFALCDDGTLWFGVWVQSSGSGNRMKTIIEWSEIDFPEEDD